MQNYQNSFRSLARTLARGRSHMETARFSGMPEDWDAVLADRSAWALRHEGSIYSAMHMDHMELAQSLVEDLLTVEVASMHGAAATYPAGHEFRHLGIADSNTLRDAIQYAVQDMLDIGMAFRGTEGTLIVPADTLDRAMEFCGTYYSLPGDVQGPDMVDSLLMAGGTELLGDRLMELAQDIQDDATLHG